MSKKITQILIILFLPMLVISQESIKPNSLFYTPQKTGRMWDTWMYYENDTYYLYYLITKNSPGEGIALATSKDGVNWNEIGLIFPKSDSAQWLGTGSIWKPKPGTTDKKYILNYSEWYGQAFDKGQQRIFFAGSNDLIHWEKMKNTFEPDSNFYKVNKGNGSRWDCIYSFPNEKGGRYGYWTANPKDFHPGFGFGETLDGIHWKALPAPKIEWGNEPKMDNIEAGAVEKINGKYYMMAGTWDRYKGNYGMVTFIADQPSGPFRPAKKNLFILASPPGLGHTYFARFLPIKNEVLINHQSIKENWGKVHFGLLKKAVVDKEGTLRMGYWEGNEKYKGSSIPIKASKQDFNRRINFIDATLNLNEGLILECNFPSTLQDDKSSIYFSLSDTNGLSISLNSKGKVEFGITNLDGSVYKSLESINREINFSSKPLLKLFIKQSFLELYIDDILIQCYSFQSNPSGKIGFSIMKNLLPENLKAWYVK